MKTKVIYNAHRIEVVVVSDEFLEIIKDLPEMSSASSVTTPGGKRIEGAKLMLVAGSMEEVEKKLPDIVAQLSDPQHQHVRAVKRSGYCDQCAWSGKPCEHLGETIVSVGESFDLDISKVAVA